MMIYDTELPIIKERIKTMFIEKYIAVVLDQNKTLFEIWK